MELGNLLTTLCGYNPYGEGYTLFLPTNEAVDHFIDQGNSYKSFDELLEDTIFLQELSRYHVVNRKIHTNDFPFGALNDTTLSGDWLTIGFFTDGDNALIKVNNTVPIIRANLDLVNGYIHVISSVLIKEGL